MTFFCDNVPVELYDEITLTGHMEIWEVEDMIKGFVRDDLNRMLKTLPKDINCNYIDISSMDIQIEGAERIVSYYCEDHDYDIFEEERMIDEYLEEREIDNIFNR